MTSISTRIKECKKIIKLNRLIKVKFYEKIIKSNKTVNLINYLRKKHQIRDIFFNGCRQPNKFS